MRNHSCWVCFLCMKFAKNVNITIDLLVRSYNFRRPVSSFMEVSVKRCEYIIRDNLRRIRKKQNLTQARLAELCGMSVRGYRKIENCETSTTLESLNMLSKATGFTQAELLTETLIIK